MSWSRPAAGFAFVLTLVAPFGSLDAQAATAPAARSANEWLAFAIKAVGADRLDGRVLASEATISTSWNYQSDRPWYPPYLTDYQRRFVWYDPSTGAEAYATAAVPSATSGPLIISGPTATFVHRDTTVIPAPPAHAAIERQRQLNPWAVLHDWLAAGDARVTGLVTYREYPRVVLARRGEHGDEHLLLDPKTGFPESYQRTEPHYLWGQVEVDYVYSTWQQAGPSYYPLQADRLVNGAEEMTRANVLSGRSSPAVPVARDSAPDLRIPESAPRMTALVEAFLQPTRPDTIRVSSQAFLLKNRGYTGMVTLERDSVFLFEATQGEERARQDSLWVGRLFPGRHPVLVVLTDLAWPHVAGVRFWVASGATIISHSTSRTMLTRVLDRRWTLVPDLYERRRSSSPFKFRPVRDSLVLGGGTVALYSIDGIGSEGALMGWLREPRFLWGSDYIQDPTAPALYTTEVWRAARRAGLAPLTAAAQHFPLTPWSKIEALAGANP